MGLTVLKSFFNGQGQIFQAWTRFIRPYDLSLLIITTVLLWMPALALHAAQWPIELRITLPSLVLSIIFGYSLAQSRYGELYSLIVSSLYGLVLILLIAALHLSWTNPVYGVEVVLARTFQWVYDAATGGINQDNIVFSLIVSVLFWFFGYNAAWHIFRIDRVWRVVIPPALIMTVNMIIYAGDTSLDLYLLTFVFMALLLFVHSNLEERQWDWYENGVRVPKRFQQQFMAVGAMLSLAALLIAWAIPSNSLQERLDNFQQFLAADPIRKMAEFWNRLVEPVESEGPATTDYYGGDSLNLGGAIRLGDQIIFWADAPVENRYYWTSRIFERYGAGRWSPSATRRVTDATPPLNILQPEGTDAGRKIVQQTMTMESSSRLIYTAPYPLEVSIAGRIDLLRTNGNQDDPNSPINISVMRPTRVLERGQSYNVTSAISTASAYDLRAASTTYPDWVANPNAYAGGISPNVAALARQIVDEAGAVTPYDRAKAIETWLRENITYNEAIPSPPEGVDTVEWFLFEIRQGYCTYYATSMVLMLRSLGIPSRMAAGFAEGEYDAANQQFIIRERDAHTWVEVYFPNFGWVEFEPTTAQEPINRDGDFSSQSQLPLSPNSDTQPTSSPTPQASPTPEISPTPSEPPQESTQDNQQPTITPTPSPTPTATPVLVPTVQPPVQPPEPPPNSFLNFLLPALAIAILIIFSVILLVLFALFIWWWWEWRNMGGLSPVSRAYARLERYLSLIGFRSAESSTPEERRGDIVKHLPQAERPVTAITRLYIQERYGKTRAGSAEGGQNAQIADEAWLEARKKILRRWLRRFIPFLKD